MVAGKPCPSARQSLAGEGESWRRGGSVRDDTFGLREVSTRDGRFILNGKPIALYGYSGVGVYNNFELMADRAALHAFQVARFKQMHAVIFRSHQAPLSRKWLDLCDRYGILVACEFNNCPDQQIQPTETLESPYDRPEFLSNFQREVAGLIQNRFNHPSIVIWSASNEGNGFGGWERAQPGPTTQAISFRPLRLYPALPAAAKKLSVAVLEKGDELAAWLHKRGHTVRPILAAEPADVIIIGDGMLQDSALRQYQFMLTRRVSGGARLLVLEQGAWNATLMAGKLLERVTTLAPRGAVQALFPQPEAEELLGPSCDYERFNGQGGAALRAVWIGHLPWRRPSA